MERGIADLFASDVKATPFRVCCSRAHENVTLVPRLSDNAWGALRDASQYTVTWRDFENGGSALVIETDGHTDVVAGSGPRPKTSIGVGPPNPTWPPGDVTTGADDVGQSLPVRGVASRTSVGPRVAASLVLGWG